MLNSHWPSLIAVFVLLASPDTSFGQSGIPKQEAKLTPSGIPLGSFGNTVAISGDTAVVGDHLGSAYVFIRGGASWTEQAKLTPSAPATLGYVQAVAVSGDTALVSDLGPGVVYVFIRNGTVWTEQAKLTASDSAAGRVFGWAVALSGDTAVVGSPSTSIQGAAYVFVRSNGAWTEQANWTNQGSFGEAVAVSAETAVIGMPNQSRAFVFVRSGTSWSQQGTLETANYLALGRSVAISDETVVAGAFGSTYVFVRNGPTWGQQAQLVEPQANSGFGQSVAVSDYDDIMIVGAQDTSVEGHNHAGEAYAYVRIGTSWVQQGTLTASDLGDGDGFGFSVALSGDTAIVGAWNAGAAYVFRPIQPWKKLAGGLAGISGVPNLEGVGTLDAASSGALTLANAASFAFSVLFVSFTTTPVPFKGGVLGAFPIAFQLPVGTFFTGAWTLPWSAWPSGIPPGFALYFQTAVSDATAPHGVAISNLLKATQP